MSWFNGEQPWLRRQTKPQFSCPFCGADSLIMSMGDQKDDDLRIEVYCDNSECSAREIDIIVTRSDAHLRADQLALARVDDGEYIPTPKDGTDLERMVWSSGDLLKHYQDGFVLARRRGQVPQCKCKHCRKND